MRKVLDSAFIIILLFAVVLLVGGERLFVQPQQMTVTPSPTIAIPQKTNPPVVYDKDSNDRMLQLVTTRTPLSPADQAAKAKLIKRPNPTYQTANYSIEYIRSFDEFLVEIRTVNINQAKDASVAWLHGQGVSTQGICQLPVVYYLNKDTANSLRDMNIRFNPLPPGC